MRKNKYAQMIYASSRLGTSQFSFLVTCRFQVCRSLSFLSKYCFQTRGHSLRLTGAIAPCSSVLLLNHRKTWTSYHVHSALVTTHGYTESSVHHFIVSPAHGLVPSVDEVHHVWFEGLFFLLKNGHFITLSNRPGLYIARMHTTV
jgi:hypothetical protein